MSDELLTLQDQVRDELLTKEFFADIPIISERKKEIADKIGKLTAKLGGLYVTVVTMEGKSDDETAPGARVEVMVDLFVMEKVTINRGDGGLGIVATEVVTKLLAFLHAWRPAVAARKLRFVSFAPEATQDDSLVVGVRFKTILQFASEASVSTGL